MDVDVGIVGLGRWGRELLRSFAALPGTRVTWLCDLAEPAREAAALAHPAARCVSDYRLLLDDPEVRAVVVATSPHTHHAVAGAALAAGKDVFVEKPLALSSADAEELCALAERKGRILMVGHLLLYHPALDALRGLIDDGELGDVLHLHAQRLNLGTVRRSENAWWSLAPHDVAIANYLLGDEPLSVAATGAAFLQRRRNVHDAVFATLEYPGGRLAHIHVSWLDPQKVRRLTVVGSRKMAVFDEMSPDRKLVVFDKGVELSGSLAQDEHVRLRSGAERVPALATHAPLRRECEAFVHAVETRRRPIAGGRSGLSVVRALEAGDISLHEGGRPVAVARPPSRTRADARASS